MLQFLNLIWDFIVQCYYIIIAIVNYFIGLLEDIAYMINLTSSVVSDIPFYFTWLPGTVSAVLVTIFAIVVIYKVIGREG